MEWKRIQLQSYFQVQFSTKNDKLLFPTPAPYYCYSIYSNNQLSSYQPALSLTCVRVTHISNHISKMKLAVKRSSVGSRDAKGALADSFDFIASAT